VGKWDDVIFLLLIRSAIDLKVSLAVSISGSSSSSSEDEYSSDDVPSSFIQDLSLQMMDH
jgi:hypothetical protein